MTTSKSLLALSNEILALMTESDDLTVKDLTNLRLTCKHTKHLASRTLARRFFVDLGIWYEPNAFEWLTDLLLSEMGSYIRSVCLEAWTPSSQCYPLKYHKPRQSVIQPEYSQLQDITIKRCGGPAYVWKKALRAATLLKTFKPINPDVRFHSKYWLGAYSHTFKSNDELLNSIKSDVLNSLVLVDLHVSASVLKQLLDVHRQTLSSLVIKGCILVEGNWLEILNWVKLNLSRIRTLRLEIHHEATKKACPLEQRNKNQPWTIEYHLKKSPYALKTYNSPLVLKFEGQKEIADGLSKMLKAREGHQVQ